MAEAVCVDPKRIDEVWPAVSHLVRSAMDRGDFGDFGSVERDVLNGDALLWLVYTAPNTDAAVVTQIIKSDTSKDCFIVACSGIGAARWIGLIEKIEEYAREQGCDRVRIVGRKGWSRLLRNYRVARVVLERRL